MSLAHRITRAKLDMRKPWTDDAIPALPRGFGQSVRELTEAEMDVAFQPIVDLVTGVSWAVEALARCRVEAYRSPPTLFEAAVIQNATGRLGNLIRTVALERAAHVERVFLNLHPAELSARWLVRPDDPICFHSGELYLEITETAAFEHFDLCRSVLAEVCARTGAHLVLDDLGAGYSNLTRFLELSPKVVKLDRAFTHQLPTDRRKRVMVQHLVRMFEELGSKVVAEGIETHDELRAVIDTGVHYGQGYLLAEPGYPTPAVRWPR
ncbi:MAG: EAL domain-containing protein [Sandaracinaceae bacterium]